MRVYAIADPHLSRVHPKPMTVFGAGWEGHPEAFFRGWREVVGEEDLVVVPGDISWAMRLSEAIPDLLDLARLPGRKVLLKGNHDYWWPSISRLRAALPPGMYALQNDALVVDGVAVAGTRGWQYPPQTPEDEKVFAREVERLGGVVVGLHHGYFQEEAPVVAAIQKAAPDLLLVGMGERQEAFIHRHKPHLEARVAIGVGGTLDVLAGEARRPPLWAQRLGLEWLLRVGLDPKRWRRAPRLFRFAYLVLKEKR